MSDKHRGSSLPSWLRTDSPEACENLDALLGWVKALREVGVTQVELGLFRASITPPPPPAPKRDEASEIEQRDLELLSST